MKHCMHNVGAQTLHINWIVQAQLFNYISLKLSKDVLNVILKTLTFILVIIVFCFFSTFY